MADGGSVEGEDLEGRYEGEDLRGQITGRRADLPVLLVPLTCARADGNGRARERAADAGRAIRFVPRRALAAVRRRRMSRGGSRN